MRRLACTTLTVALACLGACSPSKDEPRGVELPTRTIPGPPYAEVAARYNANAAHLHQLFAPVTVRLEYDDKEGNRRTDQGEGRLQIIQPDHLAMSVGKVGETFFRLGSDSQRYWWFDLSGKTRVMFIGDHANYARSHARRVGVVVAPLDLVRLLGIVPLPKTGQTQMSADGRSVGIVTELDGTAGSVGRQRTWIDPATALPTKIELFNAAGECELVADLSNPDSVEITDSAVRPRVNTRVRIAHTGSNSLITLDLSDMQDGVGRMVPQAFDPTVLAKQLRAEKIYDLDAPAADPLPPAPADPAKPLP
ncbi:MAG TPA: hypothetical protein VEB22_00965 [Phycisphaerales bacterium]|nr:hypothetical protein [Phycisphaerales bacterium]